ncbi:MAG: helix-turn-helix domain-containing protein [Rudaea sp.]
MNPFASREPWREAVSLNVETAAACEESGLCFTNYISAYIIVHMKPTLGTQLRHLVELLDGAVAVAYVEAGIDYRPRYTPVLRALLDRQPLTIGEIADIAGLTQPGATQTVALMTRVGLVRVKAGDEDGRRKMVWLTSRAQALVPRLRLCWQATAAAAATLEEELPHSLSGILDQAIQALGRESFGQRIAAERSRLTKKSDRSEIAKRKRSTRARTVKPKRSATR